MVGDLPRSAEASLELDIEYRTGDPGLDDRSRRLRARRKEAQRDAAEITSSTRELAEQLTAQLPVSDTAILLGVSKGRTTQLTHHPPGKHASVALASKSQPAADIMTELTSLL